MGRVSISALKTTLTALGDDMPYLDRRTPGVYVTESPSPPSGIAVVETAVPIFIGYTEKAPSGEAVAVGSLADFTDLFGGVSLPDYYLAPCGAAPREPGDLCIVEHFTLAAGGDSFGLFLERGTRFNLYESLKLFHQNGGGGCYVISCGTYDARRVARQDILNGLEAAEASRLYRRDRPDVRPTMIVIPDAVLLEDKEDFTAIAVAMLGQCVEMQDRVAILDVWGGGNEGVPVADLVADFRSGLAGAPQHSRSFGTAYFPFLVSSVAAEEEVELASFARPRELPAFKAALSQAVALSIARNGEMPDRGSRLQFLIDNLGESGTQMPLRSGGSPDEVLAALSEQEVASALRTNIPGFADLCRRVTRSRNILPAAPAMAGLYALQDLISGPWAPPPRRFRSSVKPAIVLDDDDQRQLDKAVDGLAINVVRSVPGQDVLVWDALTLDCNSENYRYIHFRRTLIYIEQTVKRILESLAFAPNTAETWAEAVSMIEDFLRGLCAAGGLGDSRSEKAFLVSCGLGSTMGPDDVLNGYLKVDCTLLMPGNFVEITSTQLMMSD